VPPSHSWVRRTSPAPMFGRCIVKICDRPIHFFKNFLHACHESEDARRISVDRSRRVQLAGDGCTFVRSHLMQDPERSLPPLQDDVVRKRRRADTDSSPGNGHAADGDLPDSPGSHPRIIYSFTTNCVACCSYTIKLPIVPCTCRSRHGRQRPPPPLSAPRLGR
jgi:hypothetical protein